MRSALFKEDATVRRARNHARDPLLCSPFNVGDCLRIDFDRNARASMTHQFLDHFDVFVVCDEQCGKCVPKGMPADALLNPGPHRRRSNYLGNDEIWRKGKFFFGGDSQTPNHPASYADFSLASALAHW